MPRPDAKGAVDLGISRTLVFAARAVALERDQGLDEMGEVMGWTRGPRFGKLGELCTARCALECGEALSGLAGSCRVGTARCPAAASLVDRAAPRPLDDDLHV